MININNVKSNTILNFLQFTADLITDDVDLFNDEYLTINMDQSSGECSDEAYRSIQKDRLEFIADNFAEILLGTVMFENYLNLMRQCVYLEAMMRFNMPTDIEDYLRELTADSRLKASAEFVIIDTSVDACDDPYFTSLMQRFLDGLNNQDAEYAQMLGIASSLLTEDGLWSLSYVISNFFFLLRAYANNDDLFGKTIFLVNQVKGAINDYKDLGASDMTLSE